MRDGMQNLFCCIIFQFEASKYGKWQRMVVYVHPSKFAAVSNGNRWMDSWVWSLILAAWHRYLQRSLTPRSSRMSGSTHRIGRLSMLQVGAFSKFEIIYNFRSWFHSGRLPRRDVGKFRETWVGFFFFLNFHIPFLQRAFIAKSERVTERRRIRWFDHYKIELALGFE